MALVSVCGAECGIVTAGLATAVNRHWNSINSSPAISTSVVRTGSRSWSFGATNTYLSRTLAASQTIGYACFWFQITDATPSSDVQIAILRLTAGSNFSPTIKTTGVLEMSFGGNAPQSTPALADNTWYGVEMEVDIRANPNLVRWRWYSPSTGWVNQTNVSYAQAATTFVAADGWGHGMISGPASGTTLYIDDWMLGTGTTQGEDWSSTVPQSCHMKRYLPNADGTHSAFTTGDFKLDNSSNLASSATTIYQALDDDNQTSLTDGQYISQNVAGAGKYIRLRFADEDGEQGAPRGVGVTSTHHSSGTGANEMHLRVSDDDATWTNVWGNWAAAGVDTSDTTAHFLHKVLTTKPSGGAWTRTALNSTEAEWGNSDDVIAIPFIDSVSLEVAWPDYDPVHVDIHPQLLPQ